MWFHKLSASLSPADEDSAKFLNRLEDGEAILMKRVSVRSGAWHRWYFACCSEIGKQQDPERLTATIDYAIRFWSGHVEEIRDNKGRVMEVAKRIAFDKLTADEWAQLWPTFEQTMIDKFGFDPVRFKDGHA